MRIRPIIADISNHGARQKRKSKLIANRTAKRFGTEQRNHSDVEGQTMSAFDSIKRGLEEARSQPRL
jgi:hypothetical protein